MSLDNLETLNSANDRIVYGMDHENWTDAQRDLYDFGSRVAVAKYSSLADLTGVDEVCRVTKHIANLPTMIDYKLHDNPDTMEKRARAITTVGASIITVHAGTTDSALKSTIKGVNEALGEEPESDRRVWVLGVTVLTSVDDDDCVSIYGDNRAHKVKEFAGLAADCGLNGVVCSVQETEAIKNDPNTEYLKVFVPGIRPYFMPEKNDQAMTATPAEAIRAGADFIIPSRAISRAKDFGLTGGEAVQIIAEEISEAM